MDIGRVQSVEQETLEAQGPACRIGDLLRVKCADQDRLAVVDSFRDGRVRASLLDDSRGIGLGDEVVTTGAPLGVPSLDSALFRVLDPIGRPLDGGDEVTYESRELPVAPTTKVFEKPKSRRQLITGIRSVDGLLPLGQGHQYRIVAGNGVGLQTTLAMMARFSEVDVVVAALVGRSPSDAFYFVEDLGEAVQRSSLFYSPPYATRTLQRLTLRSAVDVSCAFSRSGKRVLLLVDSLSSWLELGTEAELCELVEQARFCDGGGVTGIYRLAPEEDDHRSNSRTYFNGTLFLTKEMAEDMVYPAFDPVRSYTNRDFLPDHIDLKTYRVREVLNVYKQNEDFIRIGAIQPGFNIQIDRAVEYYPRVLDFLRQGIAERSELKSTLGRLKSIFP